MIVARDGFARCANAGTAFLMIRRGRSRRTLCRLSPAKYQHVKHAADPLRQSPNRFALFECLIDTTTASISRGLRVLPRWERSAASSGSTSRASSPTPDLSLRGDFSTQSALPPRAESARVRG